MVRQIDGKMWRDRAAWVVTAALVAAFPAIASADAPVPGVTYDCGTGRAKFKAVSCDAEYCDLFYLNPYSPGGGTHIRTARSSTDDMLRNGCQPVGGAAPQAPAPGTPTPAPANPQPNSPPAAPALPPSSVHCPAEDHPDPRSMEGIVKGLIRSRYEKAPQDRVAGDPEVTVTFSSFQIGSPRAYALPSGSYESTDGPGGTAGTRVYPVHATYLVCSDYPGYAPTGYRGQIKQFTNDNTFSCFQNAFNFKGQWQCNLGQGRMGETQYIKK